MGSMLGVGLSCCVCSWTVGVALGLVFDPFFLAFLCLGEEVAESVCCVGDKVVWVVLLVLERVARLLGRDVPIRVIFSLDLKRITHMGNWFFRDPSGLNKTITRTEQER